MIPIAKRYHVDSIFALTQAEDVWTGVQKLLFKGADSLHFHRKGDLPELRAKQSSRGIIIHLNAFGEVQCTYKGIPMVLTGHDRFQRDELYAVTAYLYNPKQIEHLAVKAYSCRGQIFSTYRPCYATLVCKTIRGKLRVFVHLTLEGRPFSKYNADGRLRHSMGQGTVGADIGTQTVAYTSDTEVGLANLAERGRSIQCRERQQRIVYRAMDRSRRVSNPDNYNSDGTVKKGRKEWQWCQPNKKRLALLFCSYDFWEKQASNYDIALCS